MATVFAGVIGWGVSDGETIDSPATRWSTLSRADVGGGATPLAVRGGIWPSGGNPLSVANGPGAMQVTLNAGSCVIPGNSSSTPPFGLTLLANSTFDVPAANATNPRIDLLIARVNSPGTPAAYGQFELISGTPAASPVRPTVPNTGNDHSIVLKTISVPAAVTTITAGMVTSNAATDAQFAAAPGGSVLVPLYSNLLSGGVTLQTGTPFFSTGDNMPGWVTPAGATLWSPMGRYFRGVITTNASGDGNADIGLYLSSGFVAVPFPNAILAATIQDCTPTGSFGPIDIKWTASFSTAATVTFRCYDGASGSALTSVTVDVAIMAWGR